MTNWVEGTKRLNRPLIKTVGSFGFHALDRLQ